MARTKAKAIFYLNALDPEDRYGVIDRAAIKLLQNAGRLSSDVMAPKQFGSIWDQLSLQLNAILNRKEFQPPQNLTDEDAYNISELAHSIDFKIRHPEVSIRRKFVDGKLITHFRSRKSQMLMDTSGISPQKLASLARGDFSMDE